MAEDGEAGASGIAARDVHLAARVEIKQLGSFLAVAEHLSFTAAARWLGIAQPALSQQIQALEQLLGVRLFERSKRHVALTAEGRALLVHAERMTNLARAAVETVRAIGRGEEGTIAIGAVASSIYSTIPQVLARFRTTHPGVQTRLVQMTISAQLAALQDEAIDVGFVRGPADGLDLSSIVLIREPFEAIVPADHPFADRTTLSLREVGAEPVVAIDSASTGSFRRLVFAALGGAEWNPRYLQLASDTHTLMGLVASGAGVSLVPASLKAMAMPGLRFVPIAEQTPHSTIELIWREDRLSAAARRFVAAVREMAPPAA